MSISGIPNSFTTPGVYVNVTINDSTTSNETFNILYIGKAASGSPYASNPALYPVTSLSQLASDFGTSSDIYKLVSAHRGIDTATPIYALNVVGGTVEQTTSNGTIEDISSVLSTSTQTTNMAGTNISASGGSGSGATFDVTSSANSDNTAFTPASVKINSGGSGYKLGDKLTIENVGTITVTELDSETSTVPESDLSAITDALKNVGNLEIDIFAGLYNSAEAIEAFDTYFTNTWGYDSELYGHYITIEQTDDMTQAIKDASNFNKTICSSILISNDNDECIFLGEAVAQIASRTQENASLPLRNFSINAGTVSIDNRLDVATRETMFANGYCTVSCDSAGNPTLERTRIGATTDNGLPINDTSLETRFQTVYCAKAVRSAFAPYVNTPKIIMNDNDTFIASTFVITPSVLKTAGIALYKSLVNDLIATDIDTFKKNLVVAIDQDVNGRIDIIYPITLASGLNQITINLSTSK